MKNSIILVSLLFVSIIAFSNTQTDLPLSESEITLKTSTGEIYGSLTIPNNIDQSPLVLIIAGSGPTDRNCNFIPTLHSNAYKMLAEALAMNGISTLRYDKRGIGESKSAALQESDLRFDNYIEDAEDWVDFLKNDKRFSEIIILGHSEGSLIGMIAAQKKDVKKFISIAGVGIPAGKLLREQLKAQPPMVLKPSLAIIEKLENGETDENAPLMLYSLFRLSVQPYLISWFKYDPAKEIKKLNIPILLIQGTTDLQVNISNADILAKATENAEKHIIEGMNHIMKKAETDKQKNLLTYSNPDLPLIEGLLETIIAFIKK